MTGLKIFFSILFVHCLELVALKASFGNSMFKGAMYGKMYNHSEILHGRWTGLVNAFLCNFLDILL